MVNCEKGVLTYQTSIESLRRFSLKNQTLIKGVFFPFLVKFYLDFFSESLRTLSQDSSSSSSEKNIDATDCLKDIHHIAIIMVALRVLTGKSWPIFLGLLYQLPYVCGDDSPQSDLLAYYPFNGNARDLSGNGHHGVNEMAILTSDRFGNEDAAYRFNGFNSLIKIPYSNQFDFFLGITVAAWVKLDAVDGKNGGIFGQWHDQTVEGPFFLKDSSNGLFRFESRRPASDGRDARLLDIRVQGQVAARWMFLAVTYDNNRGVFYLNGQQNQVQSSVGTILNAYQSDLYIGCVTNKDATSSEFFSGQIDDISLFKRALTSEEINKLYLNDIALAQSTDTSTTTVTSTTSETSATTVTSVASETSATSVTSTTTGTLATIVTSTAALRTTDTPTKIEASPITTNAPDLDTASLTSSSILAVILISTLSPITIGLLILCCFLFKKNKIGVLREIVPMEENGRNIRVREHVDPSESSDPPRPSAPFMTLRHEKSSNPPPPYTNSFFKANLSGDSKVETGVFQSNSEDSDFDKSF